MFQTLILRPIIQMIVAPVGQGIQAALAGMLPSASGGASSILGGGGLFSGIGNLFSGMPGMPNFVGPLQPGSFGAGLGALTSGLGSVLPFLGIGAAILSALGVFDRGGPKQGGSASSTADVGLGTIGAGGIDRLFTPNQRDDALRTVADQVATDYLNIARSLGLTGGSASFALGFDTDPEGDAGSRLSAQARVNGRTVYNVADRGVDGDMNAALELEAKRALLAALQASDLPTYLSDLLGGLDAASATSAQVEELLATAAALKLAVDAMAGLGDQFAAMDPADVREFVEAFGGLEGFMERFVYIAENFYTDTEKLEKATERLAAGFADLGLAVPDTHAAFLELLNSLDLTTAEGRALYEAITALAPAFVQVRGTAQDAAAALAAAANTLDDVAVAASNVVDLGTVGQTARDEFERIMGRIGDLVGQIGDDAGERLAAQIRIINVEIARYRAALAEAAPGQAEYQAILEVIAHLTWAQNAAANELARFTILAAQYDAARATELVALERWYSEQQARVAGNSAALDALRKWFEDRWKEIIDGVGSGVEGTLSELERLRKSLKDFLAGLSLRSDLSPLSPSARLAEAQRRYEDLLRRAQGGDVEALREIQGAANEYLQLARQMFASGGSYTSIWQSIVDALGELANPPQTGGVEPAQVVADAMPQGSPIASQEDIERMAMAVIAAIRDGATTTATATAQAATITADAARPRR